MKRQLQAVANKPLGNIQPKSTQLTPTLKQIRKKQTRKRQTHKKNTEQANIGQTSKQPGNILSLIRDKALNPDKAPNPNEQNWLTGTSYRIRNRTDEDISLKSDKNVLLETIDANSAKTINGERLQQVDQELLNKYIGTNKISCKTLEREQNIEYIVSNLTAKRISIKHNHFSTGLFLPAFGSRTISGKTLLEHDYTDWENQGLIKIEPAHTISEDNSAYGIFGLLIVALGLFLLVSIPLAIFTKVISWETIGIVASIAFVLMIFSVALAGRNLRSGMGNLIGWLKFLPGILLVLASGVGLPVLIVYFFGDGKSLMASQTFELGSLGRLMQLSFVSIAAMLPAFLFYLFGRQQVEEQKENFYREAMLLDPNVWSDNEAKNKYEPLLNTVFDTGNSPFSVLLLVISTALLVMGWIITISPIGLVRQDATSLIDFFTPVQTPFTFGFLGAYFFTINMIYRRYVRADLTTKTYAYITMRLLVTLILVWTVDSLPQFSSSSALETGAFVVAFIIGIFPETGLALIQDQFKLITKQKTEQDSFSLTHLEGMNLYDRTRLLEEGIENIENLAHHNLMELIARTRIPTPRLVDLFDQSILYLHLGLETDRDDQKPGNGENNDLRKFLKTLGIRTATDLLKCQDVLNSYLGTEKDQATLRRLDVIANTLKDDEWLNYVQNWRSYSSSQKQTVDDPYHFYEAVSESSPEGPAYTGAAG